MSDDGYAPRQTKSGEFRAYIKDNLAITASFASIGILAVTLILYISSKAPASAVTEMQAAMAKRIDMKIKTAISTHESKNAHHGVGGMIVRYAPSKVEFVYLKARVEQIERRNIEWRRDIKESLKDIKRSLKELSRRRRYRRHRKARR